tara:strand:- start:3810 stop:4298 length:489 start_codon:yes stop_codon:yes gene_type:complete
VAHDLVGVASTLTRLSFLAIGVYGAGGLGRTARSGGMATAHFTVATNRAAQLGVTGLLVKLATHARLSTIYGIGLYLFGCFLSSTVARFGTFSPSRGRFVQTILGCTNARFSGAWNFRKQVLSTLADGVALGLRFGFPRRGSFDKAFLGKLIVAQVIAFGST